MTTDSAHRSVRLERIENSRYTAINERGGKISIGTGDGTDFTPVELLLVSIGGCTAVDVGLLTSRRAAPGSFADVVAAGKGPATPPDQPPHPPACGPPHL